jgi:hypothetical protein
MKKELKEFAEKLVAAKTRAASIEALAEAIARERSLRMAAAEYVIDALPARAPKRKELHSRRRIGPHRAALKLPTAAQKTAALRAEHIYTATIFDRQLRGGKKLGDVRHHELRAIAERSAENAVSFLNRGFEDAVETIGLTMLARHCGMPSDPYAKVRDLIKPATAERIFQQAAAKAAEQIRDEGARLAKNLLEVAHNQEIPL